MKYKGLIIIFSITFVLLLFILFYDNDKYLGVYEKSMTIYYDTVITEGYEWVYSVDVDGIIELSNINIKDNDDDTLRNEWVFLPLSNGNVRLVFEYKNDSEDVLYKIFYDLQVKDDKIYWIYGEGIGMMYYPNPY